LFAYSTQFLRAEMLNYANCVWSGRGVDLEIAHVSSRQAALEWFATAKCSNRNAVSQGSIVTSVKRLQICDRNSWVLTS